MLPLATSNRTTGMLMTQKKETTSPESKSIRPLAQHNAWIWLGIFGTIYNGYGPISGSRWTSRSNYNRAFASLYCSDILCFRASSKLNARLLSDYDFATEPVSPAITPLPSRFHAKVRSLGAADQDIVYGNVDCGSVSWCARFDCGRWY